MAEAAARSEVQRLLRMLNAAISQQRQIVRTGKGNLAAANVAVETARYFYNEAQHNLIVMLNS